MSIEWWDDIAGGALRLLHLRGRRADLFRRGLILLLLLLAAQSTAKLTWALVETVTPAPEIPLPQLPGTDRPPPHSAATEEGLGEKVAGLHLFGQAAPAMGEEPEAVPVDVPPTTLNLVLKGVVAATPMEQALAIIGEKGKQDAVYGVGDELPGKAVVKAIHIDQVILQRAGKLETLFLEELASSGQAPAAASPHRQIDRSLMEQRLANIPELAKEVGVEIESRNGSQYGYKLVSASGSQFLENLGLKAGDVLYEVNGIRLSDASQAISAYEKLQNAQEVWLVFERDGRRQTKTFSIK